MREMVYGTSAKAVRYGRIGGNRRFVARYVWFFASQQTVDRVFHTTS
jgi:hypothetical protein